MRTILTLAWVAILSLTYAQQFQGPLRVHPNNGRYFTDNSGQAIYLTGSHTWANFQEIGLAGENKFDWQGYLTMMKEHHHNFIRLWVWEQAALSAWTQDRIEFNPLPYKKAQQKGATLYDLNKWNENYFIRLRTRVEEAASKGIYVSIMLFQGWSQNKTNTPNADPWISHPFNPKNNINGVGKAIVNQHQDDAAKATLHSLKNGDALKYQEAYVKKVIETLNDLDNVLYEIINEGGTKEWQYHMIKFIKAEERKKDKQHPVGMTHAVSVMPPMMNSDLWESPADWISPAKEPQEWMYPGSVYLEDYQNNPPANKGNKVVINDTDHLWGHGGTHQWVWKSFLRGLNPIFMDPWQNLAGKLDENKMTWMFIKGGISKDDRNYPDWEPVRKNMGYTKLYADKMNLIAMEPKNELSSTGYCLANDGQEYLIYFPFGGTATINLRGNNVSYQVEWFIPNLNRTLNGTKPLAGGDYITLTAPYEAGDAVLYLKAIAK